MGAQAQSAGYSPVVISVVVAMLCNLVLAMCATWIRNEKLLRYAINIFVCIACFIVTLILWAPYYLFHPEEAKRLGLEAKPIPPTLVLIAVVVVLALWTRLCGQKPGKSEQL